MAIRKLTKQAQDSTLAYYVNQLENFDQTVHMPLTSVSWGRDIQLRGNVSLANESTSFTRSTFAASGTQSARPANINNGPSKPWISPNSTALPGVSVNGEKLTLPLRPLGRELNYSFIELQRSQLMGQPIDSQQMDALKLQYQMEVDAMVYIGDIDVGAEGLVNQAGVVATNAPAGLSGSSLWANKTPTEILKDVNDLLSASWTAAALAVCPSALRIPPAQFSLLATTLVSSAGTTSILEYVAINCISNKINGKPLDIQPLKWLTGRGADSSDRAFVYTNDLNYVRFPLVPIQRQNAYYMGIKFFAPYTYGFGELEVVYPETMRYLDKI